MSESVIIELNQRNSVVSAPGNFKCQLAEPIVVHEGDQLSFRMGSIDVLKTSPDTIIIPAETNLTIAFSYVDVDYALADKLRLDGSGAWTGRGGGIPTFDYFAGYNQVGLRTLTGITATILGFQLPSPPYAGYPGGSFLVGTFGTGSSVDPRVAFQATFSYLDANNDLQFFKCSGNNTQIVDPPQGWRLTAYGVQLTQQTNLPQGQFRLLSLDGSPLPSIVFKEGSIKISNISGYWPGKFLNGDLTQVSFGPGGSFSPFNPAGTQFDLQYQCQLNQFSFNILSTAGGSTNLNLDVQTATAVLKPGAYDPASLAVELTQLFAGSGGLFVQNGQTQFQPNNPILTRTDASLNENLVFRRLDFSGGGDVSFTNLNTYYYSQPYFIGASTFALEYGKAGMDTFQLSYAHIPFSNPARIGEQDIGLFHYTDPSTNQLNYAEVSVSSKIVIHDLQPESFWQNTLGLRNKLIVPLQEDSNGVKFYDKQSMLTSTTQGFFGLGAFMFPAEQVAGVYLDPRRIYPIPPTSNPTYVDITGQSLAVIGQSAVENNSEAFYLIEVQGVFRRTGGYIDDKENRISICAIGSTQYLNANVVTIFSDSAIPYVHRGESYTITEATVRILDPVTKEAAFGLGVNTCIFLQVDKIIEQAGDLPPKTNPPQQEREGVK